MDTARQLRTEDARTESQFLLSWQGSENRTAGASTRAHEAMARELEGKVAVVTGAASGIGLASTKAMLAAGARVVMVDRDENALSAHRSEHGEAVIPLVLDLLDAAACATLLPRVLASA